MKISIATPSQCTALIKIIVDHQKIEGVMRYLHRKHTQGPLSKGSICTTKEADRRAAVTVRGEALT
jgi:hypothetical protein